MYIYLHTYIYVNIYMHARFNMQMIVLVVCAQSLKKMDLIYLSWDRM